MAQTTATEARELLAGANCDLCNMPPGLVWYCVLAALLDAANGGTVPDAQTLVSEANCLLCVIPPGAVPYAMIQAIRSLNTAAGTGGPGIVGVGSPEGVQTAPVGTSYFDSSTNSFWYKRTGTGNTGWVQLFA